MADLTTEKAREMVLAVEGSLGRLEATVDVALVMCRLAQLERALDALGA